MEQDRPITTDRPAGYSWVDVPFAPRRWPCFYGWVVLAAATVTMISSIPGQTMGVSVFTDFLIEALGLTREQLSRAYMFGTICSGLCLPFAGKLLDRVGIRVMAILAAAGLAGSLIVLSQCDRILPAPWMAQASL